MQSQVDIPERLAEPVAAALTWVNDSHGRHYDLTGLVDCEQALAVGDGASYELGLVLCDGEICAREQVRVTPTPAGYDFAFVAAAEREIPPLLDPPAGLRSGWLDEVLARHEFVLLLFYRGLW